MTAALRARARTVAEETVSASMPVTEANIRTIESALLRFGAECLRLEATWKMEDVGVEAAGKGYRDCDNLSSYEASNVFLAMAEERAKYLEMR